MRGTAAFVPVMPAMFGVSAARARPAAGQAAVPGRTVLVEGTIAVSVEGEFPAGLATRHHFLDQSGPGGRYELRLTPGQADTVQPGMRVRITGRLAEGVLTADRASHSVVVLDTPAVGGPGTGR